MDDRFTDGELRTLLCAIIAALRDVPLDDPALVADVEAALRGRRGGS